MSRYECIDCGSSDGLAIYSEAEHCFACGKHTNKKSMFTTATYNLTIPGSSDEMPENYRNYEKEFGLTGYWSKQYNRYCIPYRTGGQVVSCWMRSLTEKPKWLFAGDKAVSWLLKTKSTDKLCLVEDCVSAQKVSKYCDCLCLGGTKLQDKHIKDIKEYKKVYIFLDPDNAGKTASRKIKKMLSLYKNNIKIVQSTKDPKYYPEETLYEIFSV